METNKRLCELCYSPAKKVCSGCKAVAYCSTEHQVKMWRFHRHLCAFNHLGFIRQPLFEVEEVTGLRCAAGNDFEIRDTENASQTQLKIWQDADSAVIQKVNNMVKESFQDHDELRRSLKISTMRALVHMSIEQGHPSSGPNLSNSLAPFYNLASLQASLTSANSIYHLPFARELFNFSCITRLILMEENLSIDTIMIHHVWLEASFVRLEKITCELEREGTDSVGVYRKVLEVPRLVLAKFYDMTQSTN